MKARRSKALRAKSCVVIIFLASAVLAQAKDVLEEIIERNYPLNSTAKFTLKNNEGSIRIYGADISEMKLQAVKKAYSKERLNNIDVNVAVQPDGVVIETSSPAKPKWALSDRSGTVDYVIILPWSCDLQNVELGSGELLIEGMRGSEVHAQLGSGRLFGHNCFTNMHLSLGNGGLDVAYDWWETDAVAVDTKVAEGSTRVFIPSEAQFRLHAETAEGQAVTDFVNRDDRPQESRSKLDLAIGANPNGTMNIQAREGSITVRETNP